MTAASNDFKLKKILVVFGTRPEAIKLAPVVRAASAFPVEMRICTTGQHSEMLQQCMDLFALKADYELNVMRPEQTLSSLTGRILEGFDKVLKEYTPDVVLVQGDTTTAFSAALAAFYARIPVGHVEAGLRTYDLTAPFPEEGLRQMISRIATYHFAPTESNRQALLEEGIPAKPISVVGNTVIDSLLLVREMIQGNQRKDLLSIPEWLLGKLQDASQKLVLITGHRRESFGDGIQEICKAIRQLATAHPDVQFVYPVHLNPNVLKPVHAILGGMDNIALLEPLNYYSFAYLMSRAYIIISDSGGVQEEAPSLGVPVLVTRTVTERMEVVRNGTVRLVGCDSARIVSEAQELLSSATAYTAMTKGGNPYGDGKASYRILETLLNHSVE